MNAMRTIKQLRISESVKKQKSALTHSLIHTSSIAFSSLILTSLIGSGCACPHRKGESAHVVETFAGRPDGLVHRETWRDSEQGGGEFLFTDPAAGQLFACHTNQSALGGGSVFSAGTVTITVDTNTASIMGATGTAVGNIIGAAAKTAAK